MVERQAKFRLGLPECVETLSQPRQSGGNIPAPAGCPSGQDVGQRQVIDESVFSANLRRLASSCQSEAAFSLVDAEHRRVDQGKPQGEWVRHLAREGNGFTALRLRFLRVAKQAQQ